MQKTLGLVLKKQNIGETDRILTILSPTLGKKRAIARGVRRPLSRLAGHLDTLMLSQLILTDEDELPKITGAALAESFSNIRDSLPLTTRAQFLTKIVERVILENIGQRPIFELTAEALGRLNRLEPWPACWLYFLSRLTDELGLGLNKFNCLICKKKIYGAAAWADSESRLVCQDCLTIFKAPTVGLKTSSVKLLIILRRQPYSLVRKIRLPEDCAREVEEILLREITQWLNKPWSEYASLARS